jgi:hypothetical protein
MRREFSQTVVFASMYFKLSREETSRSSWRNALRMYVQFCGNSLPNVRQTMIIRLRQNESGRGPVILTLGGRQMNLPHITARKPA